MSTTSSTGSSTSTNSVLQQLQKTASDSAASANDTSSADGVESRFMTLLVTQMQNQDPLNPMDNAQLTSQLAQINTVKGIESLNTTLSKLMTAYSDSLSMQSAALVGKNVLSAGNKLSLGANGAVGGVNLAGDADKVTIDIKDASGAKVDEITLENQKAGVVDFYWDGTDANGNAVAQGDYTFSASAKQGSSDVKTSALQLGTVSALVRSASGFQLEIPGTGLVNFADVQQIY